MAMFHRICKFTRFSSILSFSFGTALLLSSCSGLETTPAKQPEEPVSVFTGKPGGMKLSDFNSNEASSSDSLPVNALLWRASLEIAAFVPLDDVDTFGGSILTEWYSLAERPDERIKLMIFVVGRELRSDAIQVRVFAQKAENNTWGTATRDDALANKIEELILTRAREMRAASVAESTE